MKNEKIKEGVEPIEFEADSKPTNILNELDEMKKNLQMNLFKECQELKKSNNKNGLDQYCLSSDITILEEEIASLKKEIDSLQKALEGQEAFLSEKQALISELESKGLSLTDEAQKKIKDISA